MNTKTMPISSRMSQPWFMQWCEHRREAVVVDGDDAWELFCASADGDSEAARRSIDKDPDLIHAQIWYAKPIGVALREGHTDIVRMMHEADDKRYLVFHIRDWCYRTSREEMRRRGFVELLEYLESYQAALAPNYSPDFDRFKQLVERRKESWVDEEAAINEVIAAAKANPGLLKMTDKRGQTLLHLAIAKKNFVLINALLELGAEVDSETVQRESVTNQPKEAYDQVIALLSGDGQ